MDLDSLPWTLAQGEYQARPLLVRFREFPVGFDTSAWPQRLNIFWKMQDENSSGLPSTLEMVRLEAFENRLVAAVERDVHSVLSAVLTCNGRREFVFHTADVTGFLQRLADMPQEERRYPIELHRSDDAAWSYDAEIRPNA